MATTYEYHPLTYSPTTSTLSSPNSTLSPYLTSITSLASSLPPPTDTLQSTPLPPHAQIDRSLLPAVQSSSYLASQRALAERIAEARKTGEALLNKTTNPEVQALEKVIAHCDEAIKLSETRPAWERIFQVDELASAYTLRSVANLRLRRFPSALVDAKHAIVSKHSLPDNIPSSQQKRLALPYFTGAKALQEMRRPVEAKQWVSEGTGVDGPALENFGKQIRALMENGWVVSQQGNQKQVVPPQGRQEMQGRYQAWSREVEQLKRLGRELDEDAARRG